MVVVAVAAGANSGLTVFVICVHLSARCSPAKLEEWCSDEMGCQTKVTG